ncbi:MAG: hypothetical protein ACHQYQ_04980 [Bacteriovoracales bacterium]
MKYFLIFFCLCPILKAEVLVKLVSDYHPLVGKISILLKPNEQVRVEWDKNKCTYDNFGILAACTRMAITITDTFLHLKEQNSDFNLFELTNFEQMRLVFSQKEFKALIMGKEGIAQVLPLHAEYYYLSD